VRNLGQTQSHVLAGPPWRLSLVLRNGPRTGWYAGGAPRPGARPHARRPGDCRWRCCWCDSRQVRSNASGRSAAPVRGTRAANRSVGRVLKRGSEFPPHRSADSSPRSLPQATSRASHRTALFESPSADTPRFRQPVGSKKPDPELLESHGVVEPRSIARPRYPAAASSPCCVPCCGASAASACRTCVLAPPTIRNGAGCLSEGPDPSAPGRWRV
jgi:hypothetical protein